MNRKHGTTTRGASFSKGIKDQVWEKGTIIPGYDRSVREDYFGSQIKYEDYGDTSSLSGWEIDHIIPVAKGGIDDLSNLQPLQWFNNRKKGDQ